MTHDRSSWNIDSINRVRAHLNLDQLPDLQMVVVFELITNSSKCNQYTSRYRWVLLFKMSIIIHPLSDQVQIVLICFENYYYEDLGEWLLFALRPMPLMTSICCCLLIHNKSIHISDTPSIVSCPSSEWAKKRKSKNWCHMFNSFSIDICRRI